MRTEIRIVGACLFAVIVTGCDINIFGEKRKESRMESGTTNMRLENMRLETESQRASMTEYAKGRLSLFKSRLDVISKDAASVREDFSKLTTEVVAIMDEKDSKGQDQKYETKILHILRNATVNAFAQKYLVTDMYDVERRLKPKKSTTEVVAEVEADTIEKLRKVMSDKISTLENESKSLEGNIAKINEVLLQIPVSDIGELKCLKRRIDSL